MRRRSSASPPANEQDLESSKGQGHLDPRDPSSKSATFPKMLVRQIKKLSIFTNIHLLKFLLIGYLELLTVYGTKNGKADW